MKLRWAALVVVLALALMPRIAASQSGAQSQGRERGPRAKLGQNYPNPFNPETRFGFSVGDEVACTETPSRQYRVKVRIYNLLAQHVATPVLQGGSGNVAGGQPLDDVMLSCGDYTAYWDGKYLNTGREAASGVYLYRIEVDGYAVVRKMLVAK